jgi:hypothetical protein
MQLACGQKESELAVFPSISLGLQHRRLTLGLEVKHALHQVHEVCYQDSFRCMKHTTW